MISKKSKAFEVLNFFKIEVENQLERKIKVVRSDRRGEYYGKQSETGRQPKPFALYLQSHGIVAQYTTLGTPKQNKVLERRNRTMMDMVRSMMCKVDLPLFLWGEAVKTTNYIVNRVPKNPFQTLDIHVKNLV